MRKISLILVVGIIISAVLAGCGQQTNKNNAGEVQQNTNKITNQNAEAPKAGNKPDTGAVLDFKLVTSDYTNKNTKINYPQITGFSDSNKQNQINALIKNDILNDYQKDIAYLVKYYYKTTKEAEDALTEDVSYYVKFNSTKLLSILYVKNSSIPGSAHPSNAVHTINIDIESGTILKFKDLINIDNKFVEKFRNNKDGMWMPKPLPGIEAADEINKQLAGAIGSELSMLQNKDLIDQFNADDYSFYFTKDYFGMIFYAPHVFGDYAELEIKYNNIKDNIKPNQQGRFLKNSQQTTTTPPQTQQDVLSKIGTVLNTKVPLMLPTNVSVDKDKYLTATTTSQTWYYKVNLYESNQPSDIDSQTASKGNLIATVEGTEYKDAASAKAAINGYTKVDTSKYPDMEINLGHNIKALGEGGLGHGYLTWNEGLWCIRLDSPNDPAYKNKEYPDSKKLAENIVEYLNSYMLPAPQKIGVINIDNWNNSHGTTIQWQHNQMVYQVWSQDPMIALKVAVAMK